MNIKSIHNCWLVPVFVFTLTACGGGDEGPVLSSLDKQALQTRDYPQSKEIVFSSVVSALTDLGFIISNADKDTGFINGISPQATTSSGAREFFLGETEQQNIKVNAFVERIGKNTKVRINFVLTTKTEVSPGEYQWGSNTSTDKPVYDADYYRDIFNRIEEGIFLRSSS